jgi:hypothetical protein
LLRSIIRGVSEHVADQDRWRSNFPSSQVRR